MVDLHAAAGAVLFEATTATATQLDVISDNGNITDSATSSDNVESGKKEPSEEDSEGWGRTTADDPLTAVQPESLAAAAMQD